jgi:hypothetical protein
VPHRFADCKVPIVQLIAVHITVGSAVSPYRSKFADCMAGAVPNSYPKLDLLWDNVIAGPWGTPRSTVLAQVPARHPRHAAGRDAYDKPPEEFQN